MMDAGELDSETRGYLFHTREQVLCQESHHQTVSRAAVNYFPRGTPESQLIVDPFYGHEELAKICSRFIRHVFNCIPELQDDFQPFGSFFPFFPSFWSATNYV